MGLELTAIIITGVISIFDVFLNAFSLIMSGHCSSSCGCCSFEHNEVTESVKPPFEHDEETKSVKPPFIITESVIRMFSKK